VLVVTSNPVTGEVCSMPGVFSLTWPIGGGVSDFGSSK